MTTSYGNLKLTESQNVVEKYKVVVTGSASPTAEATLVFDQAFVEVPDILSVFVLDTDGSIRSLIGDVYAHTITVSGLKVKIHGLYDGSGPVNIGVHTFNVIVLLHGKN